MWSGLHFGLIFKYPFTAGFFFPKTKIGPEHTLNAIAFRPSLGIVIRLPTLPPEEP